VAERLAQVAHQPLLLGRKASRHLHVDHRQQVAAPVALHMRDAFALEAHDVSGLCAGRQ
jgi:hypothetical protein